MRDHMVTEWDLLENAGARNFTTDPGSPLKTLLLNIHTPLNVFALTVTGTISHREAE